MKLNLPGLEGESAQCEEVEGTKPLRFISIVQSANYLLNNLDGPALILLSLVCSNIRNCLRPASILRALEILLGLNRYLSDETKLDRLVPYLVAILQDDIPSVRTAALKTLTQTVRYDLTLTIHTGLTQPLHGIVDTGQDDCTL